MPYFLPKNKDLIGYLKTKFSKFIKRLFTHGFDKELKSQSHVRRENSFMTYPRVFMYFLLLEFC
jgi:hypothetical protein